MFLEVLPYGARVSALILLTLVGAALIITKLSASDANKTISAIPAPTEIVVTSIDGENTAALLIPEEEEH